MVEEAEEVKVVGPSGDIQLIDRIMDKIEEFYYEEGEQSGQVIFAQFADQHHTTFEDEVDAEAME